MHQAAGDRVPILTRGCVLVAASVALGAGAHMRASGTALALGPLLVMAALLAALVSAILATGGWLSGLVGPRDAAPGASVRRARWSSTLQDMSAALGLVVGQLLVHWIGRPPPADLAARAVAHQGHEGLSTAAAALHLASPPLGHGGHSGGWDMALGHVAAALAVGLLLRWLEAILHGLRRALSGLRDALHHALAVVRDLAGLVRLPAGTRRRDGVPVAGPPRVPALELLRDLVVRRGPPVGMARA